MKPNIMKTCSLLGLAILFICLASITSGQESSGYLIEGCQNYQKCPNCIVNPSQYNDIKHKHISVNGGDTHGFCKVCELSKTRYSNKQTPSRCGSVEILNQPSYQSSGYFNNAKYYGRSDATLRDNKDVEGLRSKALVEESGGQKPLLTLPAGVGRGGGFTRAVDLNVDVSGSRLIASLLGRSGNENRPNDNIEVGDISSDTLILGKNFEHEHNLETQDKLGSLRQIYDFGLG